MNCGQGQGPIENTTLQPGMNLASLFDFAGLYQTVDAYAEPSGRPSAVGMVSHIFADSAADGRALFLNAFIGPGGDGFLRRYQGPSSGRDLRGGEGRAADAAP